MKGWFRGRNQFIVYNNSNLIKWRYRPYVLLDKNIGYTISMKLLENIENDKMDIK